MISRVRTNLFDRRRCRRGAVQIDSNNGQLKFINAPDFDHPLDANVDNSYEVILQASDGSLATTKAITVNVQNYQDELPQTYNIQTSGAEDGGPVYFSIAGADGDTGGAVSYFVIDDLPANGKLYWYYSNGFGNEVQAGQTFGASANSYDLVFVPDADWNGTTTFHYRANDSQNGFDSTPATVTINIADVADAPRSADTTSNGIEDTAVAVSLSASDPDTGDFIYDFILSSLPANGTLYLDAALTVVAQAGSLVGPIGNGATVYFIPDADWNGTTSLQYAAKDSTGLTDPTPATATIVVAAVNDAPTTNGITLTTLEDAVVAISLSGGDIDAGDRIDSFIIDTIAANGTLYADSALTQIISAHDAVAASGNGATVYFLPGENWNGSTSFTYSANDGSLTDGTPATVAIGVTAVNDGPSIPDRTIGVIEGGNITGNILQGVTDPEGDQFLYTAINGNPELIGTEIVGTYGTLTLQADGTFTYFADQAAAIALGSADLAGDVFNVTATDEFGNATTRALTFEVAGLSTIFYGTAAATPSTARREAISCSATPATISSTARRLRSVVRGRGQRHLHRRQRQRCGGGVLQRRHRYRQIDRQLRIAGRCRKPGHCSARRRSMARATRLPTPSSATVAITFSMAAAAATRLPAGSATIHISWTMPPTRLLKRRTREPTRCSVPLCPIRCRPMWKIFICSMAR